MEDPYKLNGLAYSVIRTLVVTSTICILLHLVGKSLSVASAPAQLFAVNFNSYHAHYHDYATIASGFLFLPAKGQNT